MFHRCGSSRIESIKKGFAACVADAGLTDLHPHDLRRTFGSWLVQSGVGIERVSELLRHGSVAITASVYAHLRPDDLASAAAILDCPKSQRATAHSHTHSHTGPEEGGAGIEKPKLVG
ncbi:tyrosine-type recombinase/integrase [Thiohalocapsa halophila]|uniref:tyrosine-type recombinase/integrase n=1 Tax=Thiohalocapsa halophila TaxID=69359 RepID=UPI002ADDE37D|nr:tyrosine-type recombinase/integrase [Thiohalocapsa halophila]